MRFPIGLIFLEDSNLVVKIRPATVPCRIDVSNTGAVTELSACAAAASNVRLGGRLVFQTA
jgi:hypothetical protein